MASVLMPFCDAPASTLTRDDASGPPRSKPMPRTFSEPDVRCEPSTSATCSLPYASHGSSLRKSM
eukprot:189462-Prymnesium_polylepis.1